MISARSYLASIAKRRSDSLINIGLPIAGIAASLCISAVLIWLGGINPFVAYSALIEGAIGSQDQIASGLNRSAPLILAGLGMVIAFRAGAFNIGGEGQIALGGLGTAFVALNLLQLPPLILIPAALLGGAVAGGLWAGLAAVVTLWRGAHEVVVTLLMNFIAFLLVGLLLAGPLGQAGMGFPQSPPLPQASLLPIIWNGTDLHAGIILALLAVFLVHLLVWRMPIGFEMRTAGLSPSVARYAGIDVPRTFFLAMFLSGMLGGIAGATEVMGVHYRLIEGFSEGFGFDAIAVALIGGLNPIGVIPASLFIGFLRSGAGFMQRNAGVPSSIIFVIQGLAILFVIASLAMRPKSKTAGA